MGLLNLFCLLKIERKGLTALKLRGKPDISLFAENAVGLIRLPPPPPRFALRASRGRPALRSSTERSGAKFKPWKLITYLAFSNRSKALSFEKYLKSHSGKAFANKRLW